MNMTAIKPEALTRRMKIVERDIIRKHHYTPDYDYIIELFRSTIVHNNVVGYIMYDDEKQKSVIKYLLSEQCRIDHGFIEPLPNSPHKRTTSNNRTE